MNASEIIDKKLFGMNLTGGGARGSYQAGVLAGVVEILKEQKLLDNNPFGYWSGVSAGSINATMCAAGINELELSVKKLINLWSNLIPDDIYLTDVGSLSANSMKWVRDLTFGSLFKKKLARSLLDTRPLWNLLDRSLEFDRIETQLERGLLRGLASTAYSYRDNRTVTFIQTLEDINWDKPKRYSRHVEMSLEHVMASCAIPLLFPSVKVEEEYFADGGFRNTSPISPLLHMGAKKMFVIAVRGPTEYTDIKSDQEPGVAKVAGLILNSLFFDTMDIDLERLGHINEMIRAIHQDVKTKNSDYTFIDCFMIRPSRDISRLAEEKAKHFPGFIQFLMNGLGSYKESAELTSYLLFASEFTKVLVDLGYNDMMKNKSEFLKWMNS